MWYVLCRHLQPSWWWRRVSSYQECRYVIMCANKLRPVINLTFPGSNAIRFQVSRRNCGTKIHIHTRTSITCAKNYHFLLPVPICILGFVSYILSARGVSELNFADNNTEKQNVYVLLLIRSAPLCDFFPFPTNSYKMLLWLSAHMGHDLVLTKQHCAARKV